tara:strand:+ start:925 stop:1038 length:114 start_codon:yes stop_codon:yes gene_type:complete
LAKLDPIKKEAKIATNAESDFIPLIFVFKGSKYIIHL